MVARAWVVGFSLMLASGFTLAQQMYKWVDSEGIVHYSDTPPPAKEKHVEVKDISGASTPMTPAVPLPYALAQAVKNNPVTLYTGSRCTPCDQARNALRDRGVPFTEKTVSNQAGKDKLLEVSGASQVPFMTIGRKTVRGYAADELQAALTAADYPTTKRLPAGYQNPPVQNAAPAAVAVESPQVQEQQPVIPEPPPPSPSGIRF